MEPMISAKALDDLGVHWRIEDCSIVQHCAALCIAHAPSPGYSEISEIVQVAPCDRSSVACSQALCEVL